MKAILICNVGGRDLVCATFARGKEPERMWAETALARYAELRPHFALPIIEKALHYLAIQQFELEQIVLIASDQSPQASEHFWQSDTIISAQIIQRLLSDGYRDFPPVDRERIAIWTIADECGQGADPSDYDQTLRFLERQLPALAERYPACSVFLEVTGGTPAMTTGLLIAGTEVFGGRAEVLSIHPRQPLPQAINTGRRLLAAPLRATLRSNAATYAYAAAARTFLEHEAIITDRLDPTAKGLIAPLLAYAHHRFNFDLVNARRALEQTHPSPQWQADIADLLAQVTNPDREARLAEVIHGASARYQIGLYADFLTQVVRFEENLLRLLCLQRDVVFINRQWQRDNDGAFIDRQWLNQRSFTLQRDRDPNRHLAADRSTLRELLRHLARERSESLADLFTAIDRLDALIKRRNELTHHLGGVQKIGLARAFAGPNAPASAADDIVPHLQKLYEHVCGKQFPPSPYQRINQLLDRLLARRSA
ncbi:hypothetical protein [Chloroflexus sp.]|uniref:hypothetical protein n=1 Tax=Chloroflexus sp. TaxID=1904827 RepID=UPI0026321591|nr:hypothetical protein [uncultured Chloroflexus sp.]